MLQINTGKLFTRGVGRTNALRGVLYSNGWFHFNDVETAAGTLRATGGERGDLAVVYELEERIEEAEVEPGVLVSHGVTPYLRDFAVLASFGLNLIVSTDVNVVRRLTNSQFGFSSYCPPREFVSQFFDPQVVASPDKCEEFAELVDSLLALERRQFLAAMRAIKTYVAALHSIPDDLGLSYTLLVSAVETLVQDFDGFQPSWPDVDERKRKALDGALSNAPRGTAEAVRAAIVEVEHIAMARRYRDFIVSKIEASYFRAADVASNHAVTRRELPSALRQAYGLRSQYIHSAKPLPDALTMPHGHREVAEIERRPVLTIQGLARVTRYVIRRFIADGPKVETEEYDYNLERAGVVSMQMAPQYWVGHPLSDAQQARRRLEGFLSQLAAHERGDTNATITDLRDMLGDIEGLFPQAKKELKPALYVLYVAYNAVAPEIAQRPDWRLFMEKHAAIAEEPSGDVLIGRTLLGSTDGWSLSKHQEAYDQYWRERATKSGLHAPRLFEAAAALVLAERYRLYGNDELYRKLIAEAVECHPEHLGLREFETQLKTSKPIDWRKILTEKAAADET
ncbi:hypothetical protein [Phaeobacter sp. S60]|uniref:hypothetical protein n=1 Tax=Phaeobacter sp. S60 TaxID=1569353 RepID=UPI00059049B0|nr:hypothetical protein [Phaeobacter sp. S60]KII13688.1 hypothetical protein OO25_15365 [Phaeobacter sp. S60]